MKYLNNLVMELDKHKVVYKGCSKEVIESINLELASGNLPDCYIEFLEIMGKSMNRKEYGMRGFLVGNSVFCDDLEANNTENGLRGLLLEDESSLSLTENDFVFYGSQGILYAFFKLGSAQNPTIYGYQEGFEGEEFPKIADSLSSFYERYLEGDRTLFKELRA